jgi:hypothetical protein
MTSTGISARSDTADACAPSPGSSGRCGSRHPSFGGSKDISPNGRVVPAPQPHLRRCAGDDVDAKADGYTDRTTGKDPSAYLRPWTAQYDGLQRYKVTHAGTEKKRPASTRIRS